MILSDNGRQHGVNEVDVSTSQDILTVISQDNGGFKSR